jgi:hypothetical protein
MGRWKAIVGVAVLSLVVGAGIAWATIPDSNGVIHTCFKNNNWRVINVPPETCSPSETALNVNPGAVHAVIRTETHTIHPGDEHTFTAHCNLGEVATGGGWRLVGPVPVFPPGTLWITVQGEVPTSSSSEPSAGEVPIGWKVIGAVNQDSVDHDVTVFAVCAPA